jgi:hypothetical protein
MAGGQSQEFATISVTGSAIGTPLDSLLMAAEIQPGSTPSYELCKTIYTYHPLGAKMVELPIRLAQSQERKITIALGPEERIKEAFEREWKALSADKHIFNVMRISRIYGISAVALGAVGITTDKAVNYSELYKKQIYFNVLDPLNTAGSLVLNQNPNAPDFQKHNNIAVSGQAYHRSRSCVMLNEEPIYIEYTSSAFGFVGRSVYQRALFPMKSFVQSMITDDLVTKKAGVLVAMIKQLGSVSDKVMQGLMGIKRAFLKGAQTGNVISIGHEDKVESLNMQNTDTAMTTARKNILDNIASSASMPATLINNETFASGFADGSEDAKAVAQYIESIRTSMAPLYEFFDKIVMYRAWNPDFYKAIQTEFPEYEGIDYLSAFYQWSNSFKAEWPSLLIEPESDLIEIDEAKVKSVMSVGQLLLPMADPDNKARIFQWMQDNLNANETLFSTALDLDFEAMANYEPPAPPGGEGGGQGGAQGGQAQKGPIEQLTRSDGDTPLQIPAPAWETLGNGATQPAPMLKVHGTVSSPQASPVRPGVKMAFK